jgi:hypothetical protein
VWPCAEVPEASRGNENLADSTDANILVGRTLTVVGTLKGVGEGSDVF